MQHMTDVAYDPASHVRDLREAGFDILHTAGDDGRGSFQLYLQDGVDFFGVMSRYDAAWAADPKGCLKSLRDYLKAEWQADQAAAA